MPDRPSIRKDFHVPVFDTRRHRCHLRCIVARSPAHVLLGLQHLFAMFGATVLVPVLTGLSVSATLLFAGLGTLLFHFLSRGKVPAFLGSSFAFIAGYAAIAPNGEAELLPYACLGVACAGLLYPVLAALFRAFGAKRVMRFFPPVVTGPIVISIGLILASSAIANCQTNWLVAVVAVAVIVICNIWGRGMVKIVPILLGVVVSYAVATALGEVDFRALPPLPGLACPSCGTTQCLHSLGRSLIAASPRRPSSLSCRWPSQP